jgi:hypothetical protein
MNFYINYNTLTPSQLWKDLSELPKFDKFEYSEDQWEIILSKLVSQDKIPNLSDETVVNVVCIITTHAFHLLDRAKFENFFNELAKRKFFDRTKPLDPDLVLIRNIFVKTYNKKVDKLFSKLGVIKEEPSEPDTHLNCDPKFSKEETIKFFKEKFRSVPTHADFVKLSKQLVSNPKLSCEETFQLFTYKYELDLTPEDFLKANKIELLRALCMEGCSVKILPDLDKSASIMFQHKIKGKGGVVINITRNAKDKPDLSPKLLFQKVSSVFSLPSTVVDPDKGDKIHGYDLPFEDAYNFWLEDFNIFRREYKGKDKDVLAEIQSVMTEKKNLFVSSNSSIIGYVADSVFYCNLNDPFIPGVRIYKWVGDPKDLSDNKELDEVDFVAKLQCKEYFSFKFTKSSHYEAITAVFSALSFIYLGEKKSTLLVNKFKLLSKELAATFLIEMGERAKSPNEDLKKLLYQLCLGVYTKMKAHIDYQSQLAHLMDRQVS